MRSVSDTDVRLVHFPEGQKPQPIVPKQLIEGVSERVDCFGKVVVPLNKEEAQTVIRKKKSPAPSTERLGSLLKRRPP